MKRPVVVVRFRAAEVLALADLAASGKLDELWLVRGKSCRIQTPDEQATADPLKIEGDKRYAFDYKDNPRVEVLDLHNHVIRSLRQLGHVGKDTYVEAQFTEDDEFCLVLCRGLRSLTEAKPKKWMENFLMRRLF